MAMTVHRSHLNSIPLAAPAHLSSAQLSEILSRFSAEQIEFIGKRMASNIANHLGCVANANITRIVVQKKKKVSGIEKMKIAMQTVAAENAMRAGKSKLLSDEDLAKFTQKMLGSISKVLKNAFSTPIQLLSSGVKLTLSDHLPCGILKEAAKEMGVFFGQWDVPERYTLELSIDAALSQAQSKPVFLLMERSDGIEFFRENFTLDQLGYCVGPSKL